MLQLDEIFREKGIFYLSISTFQQLRFLRAKDFCLQEAKMLRIQRIRMLNTFF